MSNIAVACAIRSACKCGPSLKADELLRLIDLLDPAQEPGRLTLICRFGADKIEAGLPPLVRAASAGKAARSCGPAIRCMATRSRRQRLQDPPLRPRGRRDKNFFAVHQAEGTHAGGVHLEMTGKNVTECTGGARAISDADLHDRYHTYCDPRLNAEQAIEVAFLVAELLKAERRSAPARRVDAAE